MRTGKPILESVSTRTVTSNNLEGTMANAISHAFDIRGVFVIGEVLGFSC